MADQTVYDLGEMNLSRIPRFPRFPFGRRKAKPRDAGATERQAIASKATAHPDLNAYDAGLELFGSLALFVPGLGRIVRGDLPTGLFFISWFAFLGTLSWALLETMSRLAPTLSVLGYPRGGGVWALAGIFLFAAGLYAANVLLAVPREEQVKRAPHPLVSGCASAVLPGLGQIQNGDYRRAMMFLAGIWLSVAAWILVLPQTLQLLEELELYLPREALLFSSPTVRWTLPAVIWALAVYDAASSASSRRRGQ
jgi:hypothetical protein